MTHPPPDQPTDAFTLRAGDVLHVPRGCWHAAAASTGQPSLHLTCGLATHTGIDLLSWLVDELRAYEPMRADLPRSADGTTRSAWRRQVIKLLSERLDDPSVIEKYLAARDAAYGTHGGFSLPHAVSPHLPSDAELKVRLVAPRAVIHDTDQTATLEAAGQRWILAAKATPLLDTLVRQRQTTIGHLAAAAAITPEQVTEVLHRLLQAAVVAVSDA
jgi:ribosomal protein L16 Arg81 hydroxylase